jgi:arylsulfatase A-like enzyme
VVSGLPPHGPLDLPPRYEPWREEAARRLAALGHRANVPERVRAAADEEWIGYHANVIGVDAIVGRLLAALDAAGLAEDTVVMLTSDHGSHVLSHGLRGKNQCYEEAVKVPWIVRWPGRIVAGRQAGDFCGLVDFAPTLLELAGVAAEPAMQGRSLAGVLLRGERGPHRSAFVEVHHPWWDYRYGQGPGGMKRALITDEWKLVLIESRLGTGGAIPWQLFDRVNDPWELHNLAEDPGCQEVICGLMPELWRWMDGTGDDFAALTRCGIHGPEAGCWAPDPTKARHEP